MLQLWLQCHVQSFMLLHALKKGLFTINKNGWKRHVGALVGAPTITLQSFMLFHAFEKKNLAITR